MSDSLSIPSEQKKTYAILRERLGALRQAKNRNITEVIEALKKILSFKYWNAQNYVLYSLLSDDSVPQGTGPFDFPGADSIEQFINDQFTSTYPDYVLFSLLADAEIPQGSDPADFQVPDSVERFINDQYESTYLEPKSNASQESSDNGLSWLDQPLQLEPSPLQVTKAKLTIPPGKQEIPFKVMVKELPPPPPPPKKTLKDWLKGSFSRRRGDSEN